MFNLESACDGECARLHAVYPQLLCCVLGLFNMFLVSFPLPPLLLFLSHDSEKLRFSSYFIYNEGAAFDLLSTRSVCKLFQKMKLIG